MGAFYKKSQDANFKKFNGLGSQNFSSNQIRLMGKFCFVYGGSGHYAKSCPFQEVAKKV